ncbi:hypothetical protein H2248_002946 [Termitomyces sp. 'cryptogamus']|nr:hypothetical protein H2248_002946 [Termitomyces sp. 'cryptogamus']
MDHRACSYATVNSFLILVVKYGQQQFLDQFPASLAPAFFLSIINGPAIQAFFANRICILAHQRIFLWFLWLLCLLHCISLIGVAVTVQRSRSITDFRKRWLWLLASSLAISTILDVLIASSMGNYFFHQRRTTLRRMKRVLDWLIVWTIQTGMLTTLATMTMLITLITVDNFAWLAMFFVISRLHLNSLLTSLNDRITLRSLADSQNTTQGFSDINFCLQATVGVIHILFLS